MVQKFAFTTAAMAAALEETPVTYEELADIENEFDDVETEIIREQVQLTRPLYEKRHKTVSQIPNFWPLVIEQAPPDIDQYIQPSDSALLLSSLTSLSVSHFEIEEPHQDRVARVGGGGDPRSVAIRWEFAENEYFTDRVLEKRFWYRRSLVDGWSGLVSEPVDIAWKKGKDLTGGLLGMVRRVWEEEEKQRAAVESKIAEPPSGHRGAAAAAMRKRLIAKKKMGRGELTAEQKALKKKIENTGLGGLSFFAWFGYVGRRISAEESRLAIGREHEKRKARREGKKVESPELDGEDCDEEEEDEQDEDDDDDDDDEDSLEIFPDGSDLAIAITQDLWPGAIRYFTQAQEQDALSDDEFESDDEDMDEEQPNEAEDGRPPVKKRKA